MSVLDFDFSKPNLKGYLGFLRSNLHTCPRDVMGLGCAFLEFTIKSLLYAILAFLSAIGLRPPFGLPKSGLISEVVLMLNTIS